MALFPKEMLDNKTLNLETIVGTLFWFHSQAHFLHLQTRSFSQHKALNSLYKDLVDLKDSIVEELYGYTNSRIKNIPINPAFQPYTESAPTDLCNQIMNFASQLYDYAERNKFRNLCNLAEELSGLGAETRYLLTLS